MEVGGLAGLDEAEMALGQDEARLPREGAEHRQPDPRQTRLDEAAVARARDLVEDHPRDPDPRIVGGAAERYGGGRLRGARDVEHEEHRPAVARGDVGIRPRAALAGDDAVVQTHRALGDDQIRIARAQAGAGVEQRVGHGEAVEVQAGGARRRLVEGGVDVVRPAFGTAQGHAAPAQRAHQRERHRGLAGAGAGCCDEEAGGGAHEAASSDVAPGAPTAPRGRKRRS